MQHTDLLLPFYHRTLFESDVKRKVFFFVHLTQKIKLRKQQKKVTPTHIRISLGNLHISLGNLYISQNIYVI